jgi:hypothetical protein
MRTDEAANALLDEAVAELEPGSRAKRRAWCARLKEASSKTVTEFSNMYAPDAFVEVASVVERVGPRKG